MSKARNVSLLVICSTVLGLGAAVPTGHSNPPCWAKHGHCPTTTTTTTASTSTSVSTTTTVSTTPTRWFASSSYINTQVAAVPTIDPNNAAYRSYLGQLQGMWANGDAGMSGEWSSTAYSAVSATPTITISLTVPDNGSSTTTFPWDSSWRVSCCDGHVIVISPDGSYVETQGFDPANRIAHSAAHYNIITGDAVPSWQEAIAPLPVAAGLILPSEIVAGVIPHAIRVALPSSLSSNVPRYPAIWSDGSVAGAVPDGAHLWLPRTADLSPLTDPYQRMVAAALETYGAYVADAGGSNLMSFPVESISDGSSYPFTQLSLPKAITDQMVVLAAGN